ncbi:MAG: CDP-alcohol phosphatidyltransferase family protein, partial [Acidimicrobiia bacterium]|nr:CDP-alcohol phosphatidyltransferase family protein [Acidimicrobiia bacterium]
MQPEQTSADHGVFTIPNLITVIRLLCIPVFLWLLFALDDLGWAGVLLCVLGATDWIDGWVARRVDQGREWGKILEPVADR